jgi:hypothetical protein
MPTFSQFCQFASVVRTVDDLLLSGTPVRLECIACELQSWNRDVKMRLFDHIYQQGALSFDETSTSHADEVLDRESSLFLCKCTSVPMAWPEVASHVDHLLEPSYCISALAATMLPRFKDFIMANIVDSHPYSIAFPCNYGLQGNLPDTQVSFPTWVCFLYFFILASTKSLMAAWPICICSSERGVVPTRPLLW